MAGGGTVTVAGITGQGSTIGSIGGTTGNPSSVDSNWRILALAPFGKTISIGSLRVVNVSSTVRFFDVVIVLNDTQDPAQGIRCYEFISVRRGNPFVDGVGFELNSRECLLVRQTDIAVSWDLHFTAFGGMSR